jgi:hypothetical protein
MKLPLNCEAAYHPVFLESNEAFALYDILLNEYKIDRARIIINAGDQLVKTDSFKILFATQELIDRNSHPEHIHGKSFVFSGQMAKLREKVEHFTGKKFELAMCLYYPNGNYFTPYHSDQQTSGIETVLPSLSLGAKRSFTFRDKGSNSIYSLNLENGSLLLMKDYCQARYEHSLPKDINCQKARINITFREAFFN